MRFLEFQKTPDPAHLSHFPLQSPPHPSHSCDVGFWLHPVDSLPILSFFSWASVSPAWLVLMSFCWTVWQNWLYSLNFPFPPRFVDFFYFFLKRKTKINYIFYSICNNIQSFNRYRIFAGIEYLFTSHGINKKISSFKRTY